MTCIIDLKKWHYYYS